MQSKCPKCKSSNILDQRSLYTSKPYECNDCGLKWEHSLFIRIFLACWVCIAGLSAAYGVAKNDFFNSNLGITVILGYLSLIFLVPIISWYFRLYKEWNGSEVRRKSVNYICIGSMLSVALIFYTSA